MNKEKKSDFTSDWYQMWMEQSKAFFDSTNENLQALFTDFSPKKLEDYQAQINAWLETLKTQWQFYNLNQDQKAYQNYSKAMMDMYMQASDMLAKEWMKRAKEGDPIKDVKELYELWLNCCHDIYAKAMHSKSYQEIYGDFMNATLNYWKSAMKK